MFSTPNLPHQSPAVAYYGGTFNPVHVGHLAVAQAVIDLNLAAHVAFLPAFAPPFKHHQQDLAHYTTRCDWLKRALGHSIQWSVNILESTIPPDAQGRVTTANVIRAIQKNKQETSEPVYWIAGQDALASLPHWSEPEFLINHVHWLQAPRNNHPPVTEVILNSQTYELQTTLIDMPPVHVSSSDIRQRISNGDPLNGFIPDALLPISR